jgi:hypothetical protein
MLRFCFGGALWHSSYSQQGGKSHGMIVSVAVGCQKILKVILLSEVFEMVMSRKVILLSCSVSVVYCIEGVIVLNLSSTSCMLMVSAL